LKILNLYAGIGGNRKLWGDEHQITAVELVPKIAQAYSHFFPNDKMVVGDAHQYLLDHFSEYDFIWASPPCQSHSKIRKNCLVGRGDAKPIYPDMSLYQEILFLKHSFGGKWVVENVRGYYEPLIAPQEIGKHYIWSNFPIVGPPRRTPKTNDRTQNNLIVRLQVLKGFDLHGVLVGQRQDQILHNCVDPDVGLYIFKSAFKEKQETLVGL
jgi:DNA (cytosine-5)-methyltransferase 1